MTFDLDTDQAKALYYACAQAEMMWRRRSHDPSIDSEGSYADSPEEFEVTCRAEMLKYRNAQKSLAAQLPSDFWDYDTEFADGVA